MNVFLSFINGFIVTALSFLLCALIVVGAKTIFFSIKTKFSHPTNAVEPQCEPPPKPATKKARIIHVNPDEVDRIYVKKSS